MKDDLRDEELRPDPLIGAALRWAEGEVPLEEVDWSAMRTTIRNRATLPLARRRAIQVASPRWVRPLASIAAAAGIALLIWTGGFGEDGPAATTAPAVTVGTTYRPSIQEALLADVSEQEFRLLVADRNDADELLLIAANQH